MIFEIAAGIVLAVIALCIFMFVGDVLLTFWYRSTDPRKR